ncbi:MAG: MBL fold metallo-hydrolase [Cyanothece sp. SIO1E1]|nr:MBL fold metallo-hydrolase [Cyanothece sp. SIO1E1]
MQVTMIGHASIFVETQDCKILMDPVLWDPFCEGLNESCPKREVTPENIPDYDFLVISHKHLDHFDIRSLAYLPKSVDVLVPKDKLIIESLRRLGYARIYPMKDFETVQMGTTTLMTTRSEWRVPEFGMVFADPTGVFWNTVDSDVSPKTIQKVKEKYPTIDFLLSSWQVSLETNYQFNQTVSFPFPGYGKLFSILNLVRPRAIAPGAQGWKYIKESAWLNQVVFSTTRERFCHDVKTVFPEIAQHVFALDPGDSLAFDQASFNYCSGQSNYAKMLEDDRHLIDFAPVKIGNELVDSNPEKYDVEVMRQAIFEEVELNLPTFIQKHQSSTFYFYADWPVIYQLEVIFPDGCQKWSFDFSQPTVKAQPGRNPLANLFAYITASSFYGLMCKRRDWDYLMCSGEYRAFHKIYSIHRLGIIPAHSQTLKDPVEVKFSSEYVAAGNVQSEVERVLVAQEETETLEPDPNPMLKFGSMFMKFAPPSGEVPNAENGTEINHVETHGAETPSAETHDAESNGADVKVPLVLN